MASVENIRVDVSAVFSGNGAELFIDSHSSKELRIGANRFEDWATKKWLQIPELMFTIGELQSDSELFYDLDRANLNHIAYLTHGIS